MCIRRFGSRTTNTPFEARASSSRLAFKNYEYTFEDLRPPLRERVSCLGRAYTWDQTARYGGQACVGVL